MEKKGLIILLTAISLCFPYSAFAETVILKSGKKVEGKIIKKTDKYIQVDFPGVPLTYLLDEIESIEGGTLSLPIIEEELPVQRPVAKEEKSQDYNVSDHKDIFEERLSQFVNNSKAVLEHSSLTSKEVVTATKSSNELWNFSDDYPNSRFADDARHVVSMIMFLGALGVNSKDKAEKWIEKMQELVSRYPDGRIEDFTIAKFKFWFPYGYTHESIPYSYIVTYMKGFSGVVFKDYDSVINNFEFLKDKLDYSKDKTGLIASEIYTYLVLNYAQLGRTEKAKRIAKEAIERFPNNSHLRPSMEQFINSN
jgi:tetratricopeptide (TPR) repeat protein